MVQALQDIKVIDIATLFAGPMAATMLADFGAEVIKIEHPKNGEMIDPANIHYAKFQLNHYKSLNK